MFYLLPAQPVLLLVEGGFRRLADWELAYGFGYLLIGNLAMYVWARHSFRNYIVRGGTPRQKLGHNELPEKSVTEGQWGSISQSPIFGMAVADLRNWLRDPMLAIAAIGPLVLAVLIRFGTPTVSEMAAPVVALEPYYPVIAGSMTVFGPALYGFVVGIFVLDDREQGMIVAYRTSPLSDRGYLYTVG